MSSKAIFGFSAASIFRLVLLMFRSVYHDRTANFQLSLWSRFPGPLHKAVERPFGWAEPVSGGAA